MKIGILTHPLAINYGGILQCYALCTTLKKLGHEPIVIKRLEDNRLYAIKYFVRKILCCGRSLFGNNNHTDVRDKYIQPFILQHFISTSPIYSQEQIHTICKKYKFEAVIVGSDQVWRHDFALKFSYNYFLDFVPDTVIKASYAASLGLSDWLYPIGQSEKIECFLKRFKGVSVREIEAVTLLKDKLNIDACLHIDPTLLLDKADYDKICSPKLVDEKYVFVYWLGEKKEIENEIKNYSNNGYVIREVYLRDKKAQISIENWLSYIKYAECVLTDSFHGSVLSIVYGTQFRVFENKTGGVGRIKTLCSCLNLSTQGEKDYSNTDNILTPMRDSAIQYLTNILIK